jgi:hypothetical protein
MLNYRGNFEIHLTVEKTEQLEKFRAWCEAEGCKCVWIVLDRGRHVQQPMATWRRAGTILPRVLEQARQRAWMLEQAGFRVVRVKIEADPSNDQVPMSNEAASFEPAGCYFEHHVKLRRRVDADRERLLQICRSHSAHLSHNAWRTSVDGAEERFVTLRSHGLGRPEAEQQLERLLAALGVAGEHILEVESEYSVYDSNLALDDGWLLNSDP